MYYSYANAIKAFSRYMIFLVPYYDKSYSMGCYCPNTPDTPGVYCVAVLLSYNVIISTPTLELSDF